MNLQDYDIYVDFGQGDKFYLKDFTIDEKNKKIIFNGCKGQMTWVKLDALHPIKSFKK